MAKENTTIYIILGLLTHEDMSGYDIKKRIDTAISYFWNAGYGQIYPTLKVLVSDGLVSKKNDMETKGPDRIIYTITPAGKEALKNWLALPNEKEYVKYELLVKLFYGSLLPVEENLKKIEEFKDSKMKDLHIMEAFKESLGKVLQQDQTHLYYYLTVLFGEHMHKAYVAWAEEAKGLLENMLAKETHN